MLNVITRSGANVPNGRAYGFFRDASFDAPPFAGRYDASNNPIFLTDTPPFDQQRYGGYLGGPIIKDKLFYFGGIERLQLNSSDVLGDQRLLASVRARHDHPDGPEEHGRPGQGRRELQPEQPRLLPLDGHAQARHERRRDVAGLARAARPARDAPDIRRSAVERARQLVDDAEQSRVQRVPRDLRREQAVDPEQPGRSDRRVGHCSISPATRRRPATPPASLRRSATRAPSFGATSFTGLEGEGNLFIIDNFSLLAGRHQFKFGGSIARQKMYMDVEAAHKGRWTFTPDRLFDINDPSSYPAQFSGNIGIRQSLSRRRGTPPFYIQDTWQLHQLADASTWAFATTSTTRRRPSIRTSIRTTNASSRGSAGRRRCRSRWPTRTTSRRGSASSGCRRADRKTTHPRERRLLLRPEPLELHRHLPERDAARAASDLAEREHRRRPTRSGHRRTPPSASR